TRRRTPPVPVDVQGGHAAGQTSSRGERILLPYQCRGARAWARALMRVAATRGNRWWMPANLVQTTQAAALAPPAAPRTAASWHAHPYRIRQRKRVDCLRMSVRMLVEAFAVSGWLRTLLQVDRRVFSTTPTAGPPLPNWPA